MEHRFARIPHGWLAGAWWIDAAQPFCSWEYDAANRLLFVTAGDEFRIEALDESTCLPESLRTELPEIARAVAIRLMNRADARGRARSGRNPSHLAMPVGARHPSE